MKGIYNYKVMWSSPYKIYKIPFIPKNFRNGLEVKVFIIGFILLLLFFIIDKIFSFSTYLGIMYYVLPFILTYYVNTKNYDGKSIFIYIYDILEYKYYKYKKTNILANDSTILYTDKKIKFI